jgi:hypothetical protein
MKKLLSAFIITLFLVTGASAGDMDLSLIGLGQPGFESLSNELGSAFSYKATNPAGALGGTVKPGFDIGLELTFVDIDEGSTFWTMVAPSAPSYVMVPKLHAIIGIPVVGVDIGGVYSMIPGSDISLIGGSVKYAVIKDSLTKPAIAVRGAFTVVSGIDQLDFNTKSLDVSISKKLTAITPYAGIGQVWIKSDPDAALGLSSESLSQTRYFGGVKLKMLFFAIVGEAEIAEANSYTIKASATF